MLENQLETAISETIGESGMIVVVADTEEIIASDPDVVNQYIRDWGPLDPYLRML